MIHQWCEHTVLAPGFVFFSAFCRRVAGTRCFSKWQPALLLLLESFGVPMQQSTSPSYFPAPLQKYTLPEYSSTAEASWSQTLWPPPHLDRCTAFTKRGRRAGSRFSRRGGKNWMRTGAAEGCEKTGCVFSSQGWGPENGAENLKVAGGEMRMRGRGGRTRGSRREETGGRKERTRGKGRVREGRWAWPNLSNEVKRGGSSRGAVQGFICIAVLQGSRQHKFSLAMQILNAANATSCRRLVLDVHARARPPSLSPGDWN